MENIELNEQEQNRREAVTKLRALGIEPYPAALFEVNTTTTEIKEKYDPKLKIGTVVASMVPIALILQVVWILFLLLWMALDLPIGPGVSINLP